MSKPPPHNPRTSLYHIGVGESPPCRPMATPVYMSTAFELPRTDEAADLFSLDVLAPIYSRTDNPTTAVLERRLTTVENGSSAVCFATGKAAIVAAICTIAGAGDNIVSSRNLYGGTMALFSTTLRNLGIDVRFAERDDPDAFARLADGRTRLFYGETISNPMVRVFPIESVARRALEMGLPLVIDNTLGGGTCRPLDLGAAVSVMSCSKFVCGTGTTLGGVAVEGAFNWSASRDRFHWMFEPDASYGGAIWSEVGEKHGLSPYILRMRWVILRDFGATMSPFAAFVLSQTIETLTMRMRRHSNNAMAVARFLSDHPKVKSVAYPGLGVPDEVHKTAEIMPNGFGGVVSMEVEGAAVSGRRLIDNLQLIRHAATNGNSCSLAIHPYSTQMNQLTVEQKKHCEVPPGYVRLSIGLEDESLLLADLDQALAQV
ncbi:MAG: O-acetylhomoserine aminocarboxypropyltransferase/cysteine synthase [Rhodobacteraceae bacterium]|nr:O-acetylhomoserine aminocarboxypropyltransferase/cysteine synthase [Paracoccaceae bacterium]